MMRSIKRNSIVFGVIILRSSREIEEIKPPSMVNVFRLIDCAVLMIYPKVNFSAQGSIASAAIIVVSAGENPVSRRYIGMRTVVIESCIPSVK